MATAKQSSESYCTANERVCPQPVAWNQLYQILGEAERANGEKVPPPLILSAWWVTSNLDKRLRLQAQLTWAADHGCLAEADAFLRSLPETSWHHLKD